MDSPSTVLVLGYDRLDRGEDRLRGRDTARLGAPTHRLAGQYAAPTNASDACVGYLGTSLDKPATSTECKIWLANLDNRAASKSSF